MKLIYCLMIFFCPLASIAQTAKALNIGDALPAMPTGAIINYNAPSAALSDFKNELVILDFWSTWCVPCVKAMPEFEVLQRQFKGKVQFVLATPQEKGKIEKFLSMKKIGLPCFVEDKELPLYFPHNSVPHEVWIRKGTVIAVTYAEEVTKENIQKVLDGEEVHFVEKKANFDYDILQPLLVNGNGGTANDLLYHSVITGYLDGISGGGGVLTDSLNRYKIRVIDGSIARLYATAAEQYNPDFSFFNRTLIEADNPETILPSAEPEYNLPVRSYFYSYELVIPSAAKAEAGRFMMEDLNRFFGGVYHISGSIETIKTKCWVLRKMDKSVNLTSKGGPSKIAQEGTIEVWHNAPFSDFFRTISFIYQKQPYPFVDKTGIEDNIDINLPLNLPDVAALRSYLTKYGLLLSPEDCEIPMLVIKNNY
ncbi:MAG: TlpA family protein disulfide reductase [Ginsengibacter sp.]